MIPWRCHCMLWLLPLIKQLPDSVIQVWYADDASAVGSITNLREWWDNLARLGPGYGYFPNLSKTWLVTKEECHLDAVAAFDGTDIIMHHQCRASTSGSCFRISCLHQSVCG